MNNNEKNSLPLSNPFILAINYYVSQKVALFGARGNGITSRTFSIPVT